MATTRSKWSARQDRSDRRSIRQEATAPARRTRKAPTPGRMKQAAGSTLPGTNPGHSGQPTLVHNSYPDGSPTTDIQWEEWEVDKETKFGTATKVLRNRNLLPIHPPLSALHPKLLHGGAQEFLRIKPKVGGTRCQPPLAWADAEGATDDGLSDADAEERPMTMKSITVVEHRAGIILGFYYPSGSL
ncbi:hypothetical protein B0H14DRAFT_2648671 [Mycena olivaceomarginata]|nr:hypothetical protein B0H14DRAFT_2648671 [Mycena olivaceomarginata]